MNRRKFLQLLASLPLAPVVIEKARELLGTTGPVAPIDPGPEFIRGIRRTGDITLTCRFDQTDPITLIRPEPSNFCVEIDSTQFHFQGRVNSVLPVGDDYLAVTVTPTGPMEIDPPELTLARKVDHMIRDVQEIRPVTNYTEVIDVRSFRHV